ncbi:hypothetical protein HMPREF9296_1837 [Prevotella disiens FB035-09AN]|uniref:Uncharacterized protein n=1 Tax=Prevotella disiens FB035-09AN TaxID=866771 RepID=E1KTM4_9BACT|nr:hypothetical protein HMPREF9296_1837 [Prevotella disiens FB035-09AN]
MYLCAIPFIVTPKSAITNIVRTFKKFFLFCKVIAFMVLSMAL